MHYINPLEWLTDVLARMAMNPINGVKELMLHNWMPLKTTFSIFN
jgi:hypothetical protein